MCLSLWDVSTFIFEDAFKLEFVDGGLFPATKH